MAWIRERQRPRTGIVEIVVTVVLVSVASLVAIAAFAAIVFALTTLARAHEWYPVACCAGSESSGDCAPVDGARVWKLPNNSGYVLDGKFLIAADRVQWSPDGRYHACIPHNQNSVRCFFAPMPAGM